VGFEETNADVKALSTKLSASPMGFVSKGWFQSYNLVQAHAGP
jgi:hypothetical protein